MITKYRSLILAGAAAAALGACQPDSSDTLVARAGGYTLSAADAVELLGPVTQLPNRPEVVEELSRLWVDYILLADATVQDAGYATVNVDPILDLQIENETVSELLAASVSADTTLTEDELRRLFDEEEAGLRLRASHILLGFPDQPTQAERDSIRSQMEGILARVRAGESFEELARTYSQDGSAASGGSLGDFTRGDMVRPFEEAAFALEEGEVSDVVETPFGLHIIRVDDRSQPTYEEAGDVFRVQVIAQRWQEAESAFVAGIEAEAQPQVVEGAGALMQELAADATARLSSRAGGRALVRYDGGEFTVEEFMTFLATSPEQLRQQILQAPPELVEEQLLLPILARRELYLQAAEGQDIQIAENRRDSIASEIRAGLAEAADSLGLAGLAVGEGASRQETVARTVKEILGAVVRGERQTVPLGPLSYLLRRDANPEFFQPGFQDVVSRIEAIRGAGATPTAPVPPATGEGASAPAGESGADGGDDSGSGEDPA